MEEKLNAAMMENQQLKSGAVGDATLAALHQQQHTHHHATLATGTALHPSAGGHGAGAPGLMRPTSGQHLFALAGGASGGGGALGGGSMITRSIHATQRVEVTTTTPAGGGIGIAGGGSMSGGSLMGGTGRPVHGGAPSLSFHQLADRSPGSGAFHANANALLSRGVGTSPAMAACMPATGPQFGAPLFAHVGGAPPLTGVRRGPSAAPSPAQSPRRPHTGVQFGARFQL